MSQYILAIDQGTTGTTVVILDSSGRVVAKVNREYPQIFPRPGWVEHNPEDIWSSVTHTMNEALRQSGLNPNSIAAIGITNQRETTLIWDRKTHKAIYNAIVWQCRRTTGTCQKLKKKGKEKLVKAKTGLVIDPYFSGTKYQWLLDNVSGARKRAMKGELAGGTIDAFLIWRLSGGVTHATDISNASRTLLMNLKTGAWDKDLLKLFSVPKEILPEIVPSSGEIARTKDVPGFPDGIPIAGVAGDQQAALFGQICFSAGEAKCTFGTGSFLLLNTGNKPVVSKSGLLTTVAWQLKGDNKPTYALEGGAFVCGAAVQWLRDGLKMIARSSDVEELAKQVADAGGVEFIPALTGLGAPYWDPEARGMISGITRGTTNAHIARATLEAMALQNLDILRAMEKDSKSKLKALKVDGGATGNNLLMQLQCDYLGQSITRPSTIETTSAGAAYLAGLGVGYWSSRKEIEKIWKADHVFKPEMKSKDRAERLKSWRQAIARVRFKSK